MVLLGSHALAPLGGAGLALRYDLFDVDVLALLEHLLDLVSLLGNRVEVHHLWEVRRFVALAEELVLRVFRALRLGDGLGLSCGGEGLERVFVDVFDVCLGGHDVSERVLGGVSCVAVRTVDQDVASLPRYGWQRLQLRLAADLTFQPEREV